MLEDKIISERTNTTNPEKEKWFQHEWDVIQKEGHVYHLKCKDCGTSIYCIGFVEREINGEKKIEYVFDIDSTLSCGETICRDIIE